MASRLKLHETLCEILGSRHVYYQPPASVQMQYPAIVYSLDDLYTDHADDSKYRMIHRYQVTLIDKNPESEFIDKIVALPYCDYDRRYTADNLNHDIFTIYY